MAAAEPPVRVATVIGEDITREVLATPADDPPPATRLLALIWQRIVPHYVVQQGLAATAAEVAELAAYDREFQRKDRVQRARKLEELTRRLAADDLRPEERARMEDFRATLRRLAQNDIEMDRSPPRGPDQQRAFYSPWIEMWKMNRAIYHRYGGVVALTEIGPSPQGAHAALVAEYEDRGLLTFFDPVLREKVYARLSARPSIIVLPDQVDFTPSWRRPIPPSYFPD
jgi:hypothetical protein